MADENKKIKHENIFMAVAAAVCDVRVIGKDDKNNFDKYNFASIDKFLGLVNPISGRHGLFPLITLLSLETYQNVNSKGGTSTWGKFALQITLYHETGTTLPPALIAVCVPMNGAQASGTAQSYALKQFYRSTFLIPTGDKDDANLMPTVEHVEIRQDVSPEQYIELRDLAEAAKTAEDTICKAYGASSLQQFPADKFKVTKARLKATIKKMDEQDA